MSPIEKLVSLNIGRQRNYFVKAVVLPVSDWKGFKKAWSFGVFDQLLVSSQAFYDEQRGH